VKKKISAKIVEPNSMLLQNLETGAYFYADKQSIEYTSSRPTTEGTTLLLQFQSQTTQHNGALSYLIQGLSWKPTYDLSITSNNDYKLNAYANIENNQQRDYTVDKTRLVGGNVQLASGSRVVPDRGFESSINSASHMMKPIVSSGEQQGLYSYTLNDKYTLRPLSSIRLPFIDIKPKYNFYYKTMTNINSGLYQGVFQKTYDLTPDHFMPAGVITVRDNQVLVGQANLPDVPQNYTQTFTLGQDNDVRYLIKGNLVSKSDENATVAFETYDLDVQIMNFKEKNINVQFAVQSGLQTTILNTTCPSTKVQGNQVNLPFQLEKGENRQCKIVVKVTMS